MRVLYRIGCVVTILCLLTACSAFGPPRGPSPAGDPARLPAGFTELRDLDGGSGRVLVVYKPLSVETIRVLVETLALLSGYFDDSPQLLVAIEDSANKSVQGSFVATMKKKPVNGVVFANPGDTDIAVYCIYDYADSLPTSYARLARLIKPQGDSAVVHPEDLHWREVRFADSSGSVRLPDGWTLVDSLKGMAEVRGPNGARAGFGMWAPVNELTSPLYKMPGSERLLFARYAPPHEAIFSINAEMLRTRSLPDNHLKLIEYSPIPSDDKVESAYVQFTTVSQEGEPIVYLAWISTFRVDSWTWVYYFSQIGAPEGEFERQFAVMMRIWNSYQISGQLVRERLDAATRNLKEVGEISHAMYRDRESSRWNAHYNWVEYIRDETLMLDTRYDVISSQSLHYANDLADALNQQEGYQRYVVLPVRQYYSR